MQPHTIVVDLCAVLLGTAGFHIAFRQRALRRLFRRPPRASAANDPAHYALTIAGMMLLAFAALVATFATAFDLMT